MNPCECRVVGFDIDGALTDHPEKFEEVQNKCDVPVGIVSARPQFLVNGFVEENNLSPDFAKSSQLKHTELPEGACYYGSWERDQLHAALGGWKYEEL